MCCDKSLQSAFNWHLDMSNYIHSGLLDIIAGDGVSIDKSNPEKPVISFSDQNWSGVKSVLAGTNVTITGSSDTPVINSIGGGGGSGDSYWVDSGDQPNTQISPIVDTIKVGTVIAGGITMPEHAPDDDNITVSVICNHGSEFTNPIGSALPTTNAVVEYVSDAISAIPAPVQLWNYTSPTLSVNANSMTGFDTVLIRTPNDSSSYYQSFRISQAQHQASMIATRDFS
jgi:hypothetical protein